MTRPGGSHRCCVRLEISGTGAGFGFPYSMATIYGGGADAAMSFLILLLLAAPVWVFLADEKGKDAGRKQP